MDQYKAAFKDKEVQRYLKAGEILKLLAEADRAVLDTIHAPRRRRITVYGIEKKTGLSGMAVILACYRLTGLGLIEEAAPPEKWRFPKRWKHDGPDPKPSRADVLAELWKRSRS